MNRLVLGALILSCACGCGAASTRPGADGGGFGDDAGATTGALDGGLPDGGAADAGPACVPASERLDWQLRILFLVDQSETMCMVDPPGATLDPTSPCELAAAAHWPGGGSTTAKRTQVLLRFLQTNAWRPDMKVAVLPYGRRPWRTPTFSDVEVQRLGGMVDSLQFELDSFGNLQAGLVAAHETIEKDVLSLSALARQRTRYVLVLLSAGVPSPRCSVNDSLMSYATPAHPELVWADTAPVECSTAPPFGRPELELPEFRVGTDLNQNAQLDAVADRFHQLESWYGIPPIWVHPRLIISEQAVAKCGAGCAGKLPGGMSGPELRAVGSYVLRRLASRTGGTFVDPGEPSNLSLDEFTTMVPATFCE